MALLLTAKPASADAPPKFHLYDNITLQSLATLHWADPSKAATPSTAKAGLAKGELIAAQYTLPLTDASHWFAVTLVNPTDHIITPSLHLKQAYPSKVNLHYQQLKSTSSPWTNLVGGTEVPLKQRSVRTLAPTFNLTVNPREERTYYLEIHSPIKLLRLDISIGDAKNSNYFDLQHTSLVLTFIGAALALSLINLLMYFSFRDQVYLYYVAYSVSFVMCVVLNNAFDLFFDLPIEDRSFLYLSYHVMIVFFSLFVGEVLAAKQTMPWIEYILKGSRIFAVIIAGLTLYDGRFFSYTILAYVPFSALILVVVGYAYATGKPSAKLLALGIIIFLASVIVVQMVNVGLIASNVITYHAAMFGALLEMVIFSIVLFRRVVRLNDEKLAAAQDKQANAAKSEFLTTLNHEIRTPLNGVVGMIEVLQKYQLSTEVQDHLTTLNYSGQQLSSLINNVLDFSKIEHDMLQLHPKPFDLSRLLQGVDSSLQQSAMAKSISLKVKPNNALATQWLGDEQRIQQILINLVNNAIKFTHKGGVEVSVELGTANQLIFCVSDSGIGIARKDLSLIFNAYQQVHDNQHNLATGTGLGLAISQQLAQAMGGHIDVISTLNSGTSFYLSIPATPIAAPLIEALDPLDELSDGGSDSHKIDLTDVSILLIEDSTINQHVIRAFLQETSAQLTICDSASSGIDAFKRQQPALVLMDYRLPDMSGVAACGEIRDYEEHMGDRPCPMIIHTAENRASLKDEIRDAGINKLLTKPFNQGQLLSAISQALNLNVANKSTTPINIKPALRPLLNEFLSHSLTSILLCKTHLDAGATEALNDELHKLSGSAGMFGADDMYKTIEDIRQSMGTQTYTKATINNLLEQIEQQIDNYRAIEPANSLN